jgi:excinuclease ABC subunit B
MKFHLESKFKPQGDQPQAIEKLVGGFLNNQKHQTLLGVTGSGKTFTMANIISHVQKPTLIISHNKTLAAQLYQEFRDFFPDNSVNYFVSYYDYYQPESYLPSSDTYIEKESEINERIERLRHASTQNLLSRKDTIIISSVSCIYGIGSPDDYGNMAFGVEVGQTFTREELLKQLILLQYTRNDIDFKPGSFRVKGDLVEIHSSGFQSILKIAFWGNVIESISFNDYRDTPLKPLPAKYVEGTKIFPATHWITEHDKILGMIPKIEEDLEKQIKFFKSQNKLIEAQRIEERTRNDIEMLTEIGTVKGIENYSSYLTGRATGEPPFTLMDYFIESDKDWLVFVDESHITLPQIRGMYGGDASRKKNLIDFGFRLPSAADNRPLKFQEFEKKINKIIYVSATPSEYELSHSSDDKITAVSQISSDNITSTQIAQQIIRPTGLLEPKIDIRPAQNQINDLIEEIAKTIEKKQRILVTTLTKRMAEEISDFLLEKNIKATYLHSEIDTLERPKILKELREGKHNVLIGINLLREGLDLPEVSLVAILDADKEGFLRNETSLIQTIGRAARHQEGRVILYADKITKSIANSIKETNRRRRIQVRYNTAHNITPTSIIKSIREDIVRDKQKEIRQQKLDNLAPEEKDVVIEELTKAMKESAINLDFEQAAKYRDEIEFLKNSL